MDENTELFCGYNDFLEEEEDDESYSRTNDLYAALLLEVNNDLKQLFHLADRDEKTLQRCLDPALKSIWEDTWSLMNAQPTFQEAEHDDTLRYRPLKPQPHLHPYYRAAGMYFFHRGYKPGHRELLVKAAQSPYYNFQALRELAENTVSRVPKDNSAIAFALSHARSAARVHHAPGYILLFETQFQIGLSLNETDPIRGLAAFASAYQDLITAHELQCHCENSIHNAYYGLGPKISNGFNLNSTQAMLDQFSKFLHDTNIEVKISQATQLGMAEAKKIVHAHYQPERVNHPRPKKAKISFAL
jgi:hypothetical protein